VLNVDTVTAVQLMAFMRNRYNIPPEYTAEETRTIVGIRFEFEMRQIIGMDEYILVEDAGVELISAILERNFPGIMVRESSVRRYNTTVAAHILGRVGPIMAEEADYFRALGYPMDALVGIDGLERDFEPFLHGVNGRNSQMVTMAGVVVDERIETESEPGAHVITTLDSGLQAAAEAALRTTIRQINAERGPQDMYQARGGSAVVIDVNTGQVLTMASTPSFSL